MTDRPEGAPDEPPVDPETSADIDAEPEAVEPEPERPPLSPSPSLNRA